MRPRPGQIYGVARSAVTCRAKTAMQLVLGIALVLLLATSAQAVEPKVGATVRLVERAIGIPAHAGPGKRDVSFRYPSGARVVIRAIDARTTWLRVDDGRGQVGWITERYIANAPPTSSPKGGPALDSELAWCPPKRSRQPRTGGRVRLASWNMGALHAVDGRSIFVGDKPSTRRQRQDYERTKCYVRRFDPDILAVQEVDGAAALARVVDTDVYDLHVSERARGTLAGKQNTGFAFKKGLAVTRLPFLKGLSVTGKERWGAQIRLLHNGQSIVLLNIHMKSGCFSNASRGRACRTLFEQLRVLEHWVDLQAGGATPFVVAGDFNRRLNESGDRFWRDLNDGEPANTELYAVTRNMPVNCRDNRFTRFIDHIVLGKLARPRAEDSSFRQVNFRVQDKSKWNQLSDHCPIVLDLLLNE